jgi:hypothetical protein
VRQKVWAPFYQFSAVLKGIQAGLGYWGNAKKPRPNSDRVEEDEELFI